MENTSLHQLISKITGKSVKSVKKLKGDVSTRKYFRVFLENSTYICVKYPENLIKDMDRFLILTRVYGENGINTPYIISYSKEDGVVILEDLGDDVIYRKKKNFFILHLKDFFEILHKIGRIDFKYNFKYFLDKDRLFSEIVVFEENFRKLYDITDFSVFRDIRKVTDKLVNRIDFKKMIFCHRDFMVRNLMFHRGKIFVIDFQDSTYGPPFYDIASLLNDSIFLDFEEIENFFRDFLNSTDSDYNQNNLIQFYLTSFQRSLKATGTFFKEIEKGRDEYKKLLKNSFEKIKFYSFKLGF